MNIREKLESITKFIKANEQSGATTALVQALRQCRNPPVLLVENQPQKRFLRRENIIGGCTNLVTVEELSAMKVSGQVRRPLFIDNYPLYNLLREAQAEILQLDLRLFEMIGLLLSESDKKVNEENRGQL